MNMWVEDIMLRAIEEALIGKNVIVRYWDEHNKKEVNGIVKEVKLIAYTTDEIEISFDGSIFYKTGDIEIIRYNNYPIGFVG